MNLTGIIIHRIPHKDQRYPTIGDYWWEETVLHIRVSDTGNPKHFALISLHEMVEAIMCEDRGIAEPDIKAFDEKFEAEALPGSVEEPGDHPDAPYGKEHRFAENLERLFAAELGINWAQYDDELCKVWRPEEEKSNSDPAPAAEAPPPPALGG